MNIKYSLYLRVVPVISNTNEYLKYWIRLELNTFPFLSLSSVLFSFFCCFFHLLFILPGPLLLLALFIIPTHPFHSIHLFSVNILSGFLHFSISHLHFGPSVFSRYDANIIACPEWIQIFLITQVKKKKSKTKSRQVILLPHSPTVRSEKTAATMMNLCFLRENNKKAIEYECVF